MSLASLSKLVEREDEKELTFTNGTVKLKCSLISPCKEEIDEAIEVLNFIKGMIK
jgi:hypothetical protein